MLFDLVKTSSLQKRFYLTNVNLLTINDLSDQLPQITSQESLQTFLLFFR